MEGLVQEKYTRAELYLDARRFLVFPEHREEASSPPEIVLQMIPPPGEPLVGLREEGQRISGSGVAGGPLSGWMESFDRTEETT